MSASLVGSEMCIRDRRIRTRGCKNATREGSGLGRKFAIGKGTGTTDAVSYTHLTLPTICSV
eukprot:13993869-Alexandrium_andersonii.AAC.1